MQMVIDRQGQIHCLYGEELDLSCLGTLQIRRASIVEPEGELWFADLHPVNGPKLGPFDRRSQALQGEILWLELHLSTLSCSHALLPSTVSNQHSS
jgi:hypothetical protein